MRFSMAQYWSFKFCLTILAVLRAVEAHKGRARGRHQRTPSHLTSAESASRKRQSFGSGRATFYDPSTGPGSCGRTFQKSDPIVAVNTAQYSQSDCFRWITITANGKTASAQITDLCPSCPWGALDLSPGLFSQFASFDDGIFQMSWSLGSSSQASQKKNFSSSSTSWRPKLTSLSAERPTSSSSRSTSMQRISTSTAKSPSSSSSAFSSTTFTSSASTSSATSTAASIANNLSGLVQAVNGFYKIAGQADADTLSTESQN